MQRIFEQVPHPSTMHRLENGNSCIYPTTKVHTINIEKEILFSHIFLLIFMINVELTFNSRKMNCLMVEIY